MRKIALFVFVVAYAAAAAAFDPTPVGGNRVAILNTAGDEDDLETLRAASMIRGYLARELRKEGFDVFDLRATFDEVRERGVDADYLVEFTRGDATDVSYGGFGVDGRRAGVGLDFGRAELSARLRLYDARTLQVIDDYFVEASSRALMPASIGLGGRHGGLFVGVPFGFMRNRAVSKQAAREAAEWIVATVRSEAPAN